MKRRVLHAAHPFGEINVTPLIDVVMVLIVFYLIVGKLSQAQRSPMRLPEATAGSPDRLPDVLAINVIAGESGTKFVVEGTEVAAYLLPLLIRERLGAKPETVVQVRGSRDLPYGAVQAAIDACRHAGVTTVRLATEHVP